MSIDFSKDIVNKKKAYFIGGVSGVVTCLMSMLIFAAIILIFNIDRTFASPLATISLAIGSFVASHTTAKKIKEKGYIIGVIIGVSVFIIITLLSFIFGNALSLNTLFHFVIVILSSLSGGIIGVNADKHKKYL